MVSLFPPLLALRHSLLCVSPKENEGLRDRERTAVQRGMWHLECPIGPVWAREDGFPEQHRRLSRAALQGAVGERRRGAPPGGE